MNICYLGKNDVELEKEIQTNVKKQIDEKKYTQDEVKNISELGVKILDKNSYISDKSLGYIRFLCQSYNNELRLQNITSHRKYIGKFIVLAKKIIFRSLQFALKGFVNQQQEFNAGVIKCLISLQNDKAKK